MKIAVVSPPPESVHTTCPSHAPVQPTNSKHAFGRGQIVIACPGGIVSSHVP
ncbi:MAG TPA: hypothetical protein VFL83_05555 [Anaeromyxobacter sp.]|nr:hypothetical protein [Anaeromyxobacter sp.]